jgi:hypothetical protein
MRLFLTLNFKVFICAVFAFNWHSPSFAQFKSIKQYSKTDNIEIGPSDSKIKRVVYILYKPENRDIQNLITGIEILHIQGLLDSMYDFHLCQMLIAENEGCPPDKKIVLGKTRLDPNVSTQKYFIVVDIGDKNDILKFKLDYKERTGESPDTLKSFDDKDGRKSSLVRISDHRHLLKLVYINKVNKMNSSISLESHLIRAEIDSLRRIITKLNQPRATQGYTLFYQIAPSKSMNIIDGRGGKLNITTLRESNIGLQYYMSSSGKNSFGAGFRMNYGIRAFTAKQPNYVELLFREELIDKDGEQFTGLTKLSDISEMHEQQWLQYALITGVGKALSKPFGRIVFTMNGGLGIRSVFQSEYSLKSGQKSFIGIYPQYLEEPVSDPSYGFYESVEVSKKRGNAELNGLDLLSLIEFNTYYQLPNSSRWGFNFSFGSQWTKPIGKQDQEILITNKMGEHTTIINSGFNLNPQLWTIGFGFNYWVK